MGTRQRQIENLLIKYENGLTDSEIAKFTGIQCNRVREIVKKMIPIYIDRWIIGRGDKYHPVYCIQLPPEDCPKPDEIIHESYRNGRYESQRMAA